MKKILLTFLAVFLCIVGLSAQTYTHNMKDTHGTKTISALNEWEKDDITFTPSKANGSTAPAYNRAGDVRIYAKGTFTVTPVNSGYVVTDVVFNLSSQGKSKLPKITADNGTVAEQAVGDETVTWNGEATSVTFTVGDKAIYTSSTGSAGQLCFDAITITLKSTGGSVLQDVTLAFASDKVSVNLGEEVPANALTVTPADASLVIVYSSSDESVATVDAEGKVAVKAAGSTTITASFEGNDYYKKATASYTLSVVDPNAKDATVDFSNKGYDNQQEVTSVNEGLLTLEFAAGDNSNSPKYFNTGTAIRVYGGNTITFSLNDTEMYIKQIIFTTHSSNGTLLSGYSFKDGDDSVGLYDAETKTWTAGANDECDNIVFQNGGTSGHTRIQSIKVVYDFKSPEVHNPVFVDNEGNEIEIGDDFNIEPGTVVTLKFPEVAGHKFFHKFTPDGGVAQIQALAEEDNDGFTEYTEPIQLDKAGTLEFYSIRNGKKSDVTSFSLSSITTGVEDVVVADEDNAEYYDMTGRKVSNPVSGLYIRVSGLKAEKVLVK